MLNSSRCPAGNPRLGSWTVMAARNIRAVGTFRTVRSPTAGVRSYRPLRTPRGYYASLYQNDALPRTQTEFAAGCSSPQHPAVRTCDHVPTPRRLDVPAVLSASRSPAEFAPHADLAGSRRVHMSKAAPLACAAVQGVGDLRAWQEPCAGAEWSPAAGASFPNRACCVARREARCSPPVGSNGCRAGTLPPPRALRLRFQGTSTDE